MYDVVLGVMMLYAGLLLYFLIRLMLIEPEEEGDGGDSVGNKYQ